MLSLLCVIGLVIMCIQVGYNRRILGKDLHVYEEKKFCIPHTHPIHPSYSIQWSLKTSLPSHPSHSVSHPSPCSHISCQRVDDLFRNIIINTVMNTWVILLPQIVSGRNGCDSSHQHHDIKGNKIGLRPYLNEHTYQSTVIWLRIMTFSCSVYRQWQSLWQKRCYVPRQTSRQTSGQTCRQSQIQMPFQDLALGW